MKLPTHQKYDPERKTTWLYFSDENPRESVIRGGICWPMRYKTDSGYRTDGYAVVGGQDLMTGKVHIYSETSFVTINDILAGEGDLAFPVNAVKYKGINTWFNDVFAKYYCTKFYFNQPEELSRRFKLEVSRSFVIQPKPVFVEVPLYNEADIMSAMWHTIKSETVRIDGQSEILKALEVMMDADKDMVPSVYALGMCLLGFDRFPWRKPFERKLEEIFIR